MENYIIIAILVIIIGLAAFYVYKAKKSGNKCIGCPDSGTCSAKQSETSCCCGCSGCASKDSCHGDSTPSSNS